MSAERSWSANMIQAPEAIHGAPRFRTEFSLDHDHGDVVKAEFLLSALGIVYAWLNRESVNNDVLAPGWTSYEWRVRYTVTDVTSLVRTGANVLGLEVGKGWYATPLFVEPHASYGTRPAALAELQVTFGDGHVQTIASGDDWLTGPGSSTADDLYRGQSIDTRLEDCRWLEPGFRPVEWIQAKVMDFDLSMLEPQSSPPIRRIEMLDPVAIWSSPTGKLLIDFGQNIVGWVKLEVCGEAGQVISVRHAEVLDDRELGTRPLRSAEATDRFVLSGGYDAFEPTLTFHGFRYCEIEGWPGGIESLRVGGVIAVVIGSDLVRTGWFQCSNQLINKLHENVVWSMKGNFLGIPTDCPQRDERLGWTGDIAVFAPTAAFIFDCEAFLRDWLRDVRFEQTYRDGIVPWVVPDILKYFDHQIPGADEWPPFNAPKPTAIWSDAIAWVPWAVWRASGNKAVLEESFESQLAHARKVWSSLSSRGVWEGSFQFGDWLDPEAPPHNPFLAKADPNVIATQAFYRTLIIIAEAAAVLGRPEQQELTEKAEELRKAFYRAYVNEGRIQSDCAAVYSLAITFAMLEPKDCVAAGERLADLVRQSNHKISTGFAATPFVCDALTMTGHLDDAYAMLLQTECPSWLYPVTMGATTIWERWDSMRPDGSINPSGMTSFNHYALGAVADWIHRTVGGIAPLLAAEGRYLIAPRPGGNLSWAEAIWTTRLGRLRVRWEKRAKELLLEIEVPAGAIADLDVPNLAPEQLGPGTHKRVAVL